MFNHFLHTLLVVNFVVHVCEERSNTVVSRKYGPPFAILSLSTKRRGGGGLYVGCDNFFRDYALPSGNEVYCRGGVGAKRGASPSAK